MVQHREINVEFPLGGQFREATYAQKTSPYSTPRAINVRGRGSLERRVRGGTRPMLTKFIDNDFGTNIVGMTKVSYVDDSGDLQTDVIVIADGVFSVVHAGAVTTTVCYVLIDGDYVLIDGDYVIFASTIAATSPIGDTDGFDIIEHGGKVYIADEYPKKYDPASGLVTTINTAPQNQPMILIYRERMVLFGEDHMFYISRQGDFTDWNFFDKSDDIGKATAGHIGDRGIINSPIRCGLNYKDKALVFGTEDDLWLISGETGIGEKKNVSRKVGIIAPRAACITPEGTVVFLAREGLYTYQIGGGEPQRFSERRIPDELRDLDPTTNDIHMQYDHKLHGVNLFVTPSAGAGEHWWLDIKNRALWQDAFGNNNHQPLCSCTYPQSGDSDVLLGCKDGYIREFSNSASNDDGTAVTSHLLLGPFKIGRNSGKDGQAMKIISDFAQSSSDVTWYTLVAETAEEVIDNAVTDIEGGTTDNVHATGTFSAGHNRPDYPRSRGGWLAIWLTSSGKWSYENLTFFQQRLGEIR